MITLSIIAAVVAIFTTYKVILTNPTRIVRVINIELKTPQKNISPELWDVEVYHRGSK